MSSIKLKKIKTFFPAGKDSASSKNFLDPDTLLQLLHSGAAILIMRGETRRVVRQRTAASPGAYGTQTGVGPEQTVTYARAAGSPRRNGAKPRNPAGSGRIPDDQARVSGPAAAEPGARRTAPSRRHETGTGPPEQQLSRVPVGDADP